MLWSRPLRIIALSGILLGAGMALGACSFSPVYGGSGALASQPALNLAYAKPNSRLEQVIYQELALRLGASDSPTAPLATVRTSSASSAIGLSATSNPAKPQRVTVTATLTLAGTAGEPISLTRMATADYTTSGQVLADQASATDAEERAARAVAESLRLALLAALSRG